MPDMLVKLYDLPLDFDAHAADDGVAIRKPIGSEKHLIVDWARRHFSQAWAAELDVAMGHPPFTCYIATAGDELIGFACYDATALGFFGPIAVHPDRRGRGLGKALLMACLHEMKIKGYGYAIIGSVGPVEFYEKAVGAVVIPDSTPSLWDGWLIKRRTEGTRATE
jgi:GNAT superfamily N-acetyltransferase